MAALSCALAMPVTSAPGPPSPSPAIAPEAYPLRRSAEALARARESPPDDPCRAASAHDAKPCFPAQVERQGLTPEQKLARFFDGFDALYGPTFASAPTVKELWPTPAGRGIPLDFLPLVELLVKARRRHVPARFFLYAAREGSRAWAVLREGRLPPEVAYARPGVTYTELGGFPDRKGAQAAYERLEDALGVTR